MFRTVECHVLKEMGKTTLVFLFLKRTYTLGDIEISYMLRPFIVTDVIGKTIGEFTNTNTCVNRYRGQLLCICNGCKCKYEQQQ
jgi:hypothetical protein